MRLVRLGGGQRADLCGQCRELLVANPQSCAALGQPLQMQVQKPRAARRDRRWSRTGRRRSAVRDPAHRHGWRPGRRSVPPGAASPCSVQPRSFEHREHAAGLGARFVELTLRVRIRDDAATGAQRDPGALHRHGPDQDVEIHLARRASDSPAIHRTHRAPALPVRQ